MTEGNEKQQSPDSEATDRPALDILVFGAHADDVELMCGGTVLKSVSLGRTVGIIDLTHAEMGTRGTAETRLKESREAQKALGASVRERLDLGDGNLRIDRDAELEVVRLIRKYRPGILIAPWPDDRHPDHTRAGRLVTDAWFYAGLAKIETGQSSHRPDIVLYYPQNYFQHPTLVVDVTDVHDQKMQALQCYRSQFHDPDSDEPPTLIAQRHFLALIEARSRNYGFMIGKEFGEGFVSKQPPMVNDLPSAYAGREVS